MGGNGAWNVSQQAEKGPATHVQLGVVSPLSRSGRLSQGGFPVEDDWVAK